METQQHKPHRTAKARKKPDGGPNPRAFAFSNPGRLARTAARSHDIKEKRLHVPLVDRQSDEPPPRLVAIVGPPGVGKTTLLKSLVRRYAKETLSEPAGPITVVTSKKQRLTLLECPNELEAMVDVAKVADIVLLMIDGNYGFEMETMEFLNILAVTGMPGNVFGILTHLDLFRKPQTLKDAKKRLKHRLWSELYQGAHLFYLSGIINGRYPDREIHNLSRFLSVMKSPRPLIWRNSHPYTVVDNHRDITDPTAIEANDKCDRSIELCGYLRGTNFAAESQRAHIPGLGDFTIASIETLPDPCPTPAMEQAASKSTGKDRRRRLDEKEKKLHAPMSDRSGLKISGDHIMITREQGFTFDKDAVGVERGEGEQLIIDLQNERRLLGHTEEGLQLFAEDGQLNHLSNGENSGRKVRRKVHFTDMENLSDENISDEVSQEVGLASRKEENAALRKRHNHAKSRSNSTSGPESPIDGLLSYAESDSDLDFSFGNDEIDEVDYDDDFEEEEEQDDGTLRWKDNITMRARLLHSQKRKFRAADLTLLIYDDSLSSKTALSRWCGLENEDMEGINEDQDKEAFIRKSRQNLEEDLEEDRSIPIYDFEALTKKWSQLDNVGRLRERFASSSLTYASDVKSDENELEGEGESEENNTDDNDEGDGAFEDLETGENHAAEQVLEAEREKNARRKEGLKLRFEMEDREGSKNDKAIARQEAGKGMEFGEDDWYDAQKALLQKQLDINKAELEHLDEVQRPTVEGYKAGKYAKIIIDGIPAEFVNRFQARLPLIIGGLSAIEDRFGFVQMRIKRHRWHKKILKTNDPLIFSLGWRRFQSLPVYSLSDSRTRSRMLKYTPEHMHCFGTFYGPLVAPNTGFVCFQSFSSDSPGFRVAATGTTLSVDESTEIVKKLKLTGTPAKVFKNTAFVKDMFNTALEIAKFEGASIKTVSGVRGQIKRALSKPDGHFRATFEDKILLSDIVFLRTWYPIRPHRFYNLVTNLIGWQSMRLTGQVRHDEGIATPQQKDSQYRAIDRPKRHFNSLQVPRALAAQLPFKSQIIRTQAQTKPTYLQKRAVIVRGEERKARDLMQKLTTIRKEVAEKRRQKKEEKRAEYRKRVAELQEKQESRSKRESKAFWEKEGRKRKSAQDGAGGGKRRK